MSLAVELIAPSDLKTGVSTELADLEHEIAHAAHLLPSQGPITVFVHHNTLHAFEDLPFESAVFAAQRLYGCEPYLSEARYRQELEVGRILPHDLHLVLLDDLNDQGDVLIGCLGTRHELQLAMLRYPLFDGSDAEIRWFIEEADALIRFREDVSPIARRRLIDSTKHWIQRDLLANSSPVLLHVSEDILRLLRRFDATRMEDWSEQAWETVTLHLLWQFSRQGVSHVKNEQPADHRVVRPRDVLLKLTGEDIDRMVNPELIRFCAAYLDQGYASWQLPDRESGFFESYYALVRDSHPTEEWMRGLPAEMARLKRDKVSPLASVAESLDLLGVDAHERQEFLSQTLLALRGWAGMIWQMETNGDWTVRPAHKNALVEYLAVRLILERLAIAHVVHTHLAYSGPLSELRNRFSGGDSRPISAERRAFQVFQLAQLRSWSPAELSRLSPREWRQLEGEIESFDSLRRRRIYHLAYERRYRVQTLDAVSAFSARHPETTREPCAARMPAYQVVCCIDEREESLRRHLEEIDPAVETFAIAGFFGVAMYYRGATEAHYRPLCPVNVNPVHYVREEAVYSLERVSERQASARRWAGQLAHQIHRATRTVAGGIVTGLLGSAASLPLVMRILFPRTAAKAGGLFHTIVQPSLTQLRLERVAATPGMADEQVGYSVSEMARTVEGSLRALGLTRRMAPLVLIVGHGSSSLNNPHEAAHDCGACGGGRGGPNARAFAQMANDPRVRAILAERSLVIPDQVTFVGAYHNTCDDSMTYYDLDRISAAKRQLLDRARAAIDEARKRDAQERCRRFESAPLSLSDSNALRHVEGRAEDLSQVRPEYGHATNAVCIVGRRSRTRGLFLDRRTFLTSYDPTQDDRENSILAGLLSAVIPVCAGINLEYYFSVVDPSGYGCGTKLPHNITSILGVMDGPESDLRTGLPWQMVEIHEPVRILFIIETTPQAMISIMERNPAIDQLVRNRWVQLSVLDPHSGELQLFRDGRFEVYVPEDTTLPVVASSYEWFRGWRQHLGYAEIVPAKQTEFAGEGKVA